MKILKISFLLTIILLFCSDLVSAKNKSVIQNISFNDTLEITDSPKELVLFITTKKPLKKIRAKFTQRNSKNKPQKRTKTISTSTYSQNDNGQYLYELKIPFSNSKKLGTWNLKLNLTNRKKKRQIFTKKRLKKLNLKYQLTLVESNVNDNGGDSSEEDENTPEEDNDNDDNSIESPNFGNDDSEPQVDLFSLLESSPLNNETDVALTRETILKFNKPILESSVKVENFKIKSAGQILNYRLHLSKDHKKVSIFYSSPLPANSEIRVSLKAQNIINNENEILGKKDLNLIFRTLGISTINEDTQVCGKVYASMLDNSTGEALENVTITVDNRESDLKTTTDSTGAFCLMPAPIGKFFVHINGKTAINLAEEGSYYPNVGKSWESKINQTTNIGTIYLPLVKPNTLQTTSPTENTKIKFPQNIIDNNPNFEDVYIEVAANSLFSDDGTRGGQVGIAPVNPNQLPGELPPWFNFPIVITVQTDGASNFDEPAKVCFPNLPIEGNDHPLKPGEKSALWSFNHDTGKFEMAGSMTVSKNGSLVCSDEGSGVIAPGWHAAQPGSSSQGTPPSDESDDNNDDEDEEDDCDKKSKSNNKKTYDVASQVLNCAQGFNKVLRALDCINEAYMLSQSLISDINSLQASLDPNNPVSKSVVKQLASSLIKKKQSIVNLIECLKSASPLSILDNALNCIENALSVAEEICKNNDESGGGKCDEGSSDSLSCKGWAQARQIYNYANNLYALVTQNIKTLSQESICALLENIQITLDLQEDQDSQSNHRLRNNLDDDNISPEEISELKNLLFNLKTEIDILDQTVKETRMNELGDSYLELIQRADQIAKESGSSYQSKDKPIEEDYFYVLESSGLARRGKTKKLGVNDLVMSPETEYFLAVYYPTTNSYGEIRGISSRSGIRTILNSIILSDANNLPDSDNDRLSDKAEFVLGTSATNPDSDNDGKLDGIEVQSGEDPLSGQINRLGIINSLNTREQDLTLCSLDNFVIDGHSSGVHVIDVSDFNNLAIVRTFNESKSVNRVSCLDNSFTYTLRNDKKVTIVDYDKESNSFNTQEINFESPIIKAIKVGNLVYGISTNRIHLYDIKNNSFSSLQNTTSNDTNVDIDTGNNKIIALSIKLDRSNISQHSVYSWDIEPHLSEDFKKITINAFTFFGTDRLPTITAVDEYIFVSGIAAPRGRFVAVPGIEVISADDGLSLLSGASETTSIKTAIDNSYKALFTGSNNNLSSRDLGILDLSDPTQTDNFLASFDIAGSASDVTINKNLAFVSDSSSRRGINIINYFNRDINTIAPTINEVIDNSENQSIERKSILYINPRVEDDVVATSVKLYIDDELVTTDNSFPFEFYHYIEDRPDKDELIYYIEVYDSANNVTRSQETTLNLINDTRGPKVIGTVPQNDLSFFEGEDLEFNIFFSEEILEPVQLATLIAPGLDGGFGTSDDINISDLTCNKNGANSISCVISKNLSAGSYQIKLNPEISDLINNKLTGNSILNLTIASTEGRTNKWIGAIDNSWSTPGNWELGFPPSRIDNVIINDSSSNIIINRNIAVRSINSSGNFTIQDSQIELSQGIFKANFINAKGLILKNTILDSIIELRNGLAFANEFHNVTLLKYMRLNNTQLNIFGELLLNNAVVALGRGFSASGVINFIGEEPRLSGVGEIRFLGRFDNRNGIRVLTENAKLNIEEGIKISATDQNKGFIGYSSTYPNDPQNFEIINHGELSFINNAELKISSFPFTNFGKLFFSNGGSLNASRFEAQADIEDMCNFNSAEIEVNNSILTCNNDASFTNFKSVNSSIDFQNHNIDFIQAQFSNFSASKSNLVNTKISGNDNINFNLLGDISFDNVILDINITVPINSFVFSLAPKVTIDVKNSLAINKSIIMHPDKKVDFVFNESQSLKGNGRIIISERDGPGAQNFILGNGVSLTIEENLTIRQINEDYFDIFNSNGAQATHLINKGTFVVGTGAHLDVETDSFTNLGQIQLASGHIRTKNNFNNLGKLKILNGSIRTNGLENNLTGELEFINSAINLSSTFVDTTNFSIANPRLYLNNSKITNLKEGLNIQGFTLTNGSELSSDSKSIAITLNGDNSFNLFNDSLLKNLDLKGINNAYLNISGFKTFFDNVNVDIDLKVGQGRVSEDDPEINTLFISNGLSLNKTIFLGSRDEDQGGYDSFGILRFMGSQSFTGNGEVIFGDSFFFFENEDGEEDYYAQNLVIQGQESAELIIDNSLTLSGKVGGIGAGIFEDDPENIKFVNKAKIEIEANGYLDTFGDDIRNLGEISIGNNGELIAFNHLHNYGEINLSNTKSYFFGDDNTNNGLINISNGNIDIYGIEILTQGKVTINEGAKVEAYDSFKNNGIVELKNSTCSLFGDENSFNRGLISINGGLLDLFRIKLENEGNYKIKNAALKLSLSQIQSDKNISLTKLDMGINSEIHNSGSTIFLNSVSSALNDKEDFLVHGGAIFGGEIHMNNGERLRVEQNFSHFDDLAIHGMLVVGNIRTTADDFKYNFLKVTNGLELYGTMYLGRDLPNEFIGGPNFGMIEFHGEQTFKGDGVIHFGRDLDEVDFVNNFFNRTGLIVAEENQPLTIESGLEIRGGAGRVGRGGFGFNPANVTFTNKAKVISRGIIEMEGVNWINEGELIEEFDGVIRLKGNL